MRITVRDYARQSGMEWWSDDRIHPVDAGLVERVRTDWKAVRPLVGWLTAVEVEVY